MKRTDQLQFVMDILNNLQRDITDQIKSGRIPEEWNGFELRQYISDYFSFNYYDNTKLKGKRKRDYKNTCLVNNLF